jgi:hypothetical protein
MVSKLAKTRMRSWAYQRGGQSNGSSSGFVAPSSGEQGVLFEDESLVTSEEILANRVTIFSRKHFRRHMEE